MLFPFERGGYCNVNFDNDRTLLYRYMALISDRAKAKLRLNLSTLCIAKSAIIHRRPTSLGGLLGATVPGQLALATDEPASQEYQEKIPEGKHLPVPRPT